jgi:hypothetical protein
VQAVSVVAFTHSRCCFHQRLAHTPCRPGGGGAAARWRGPVSGQRLRRAAAARRGLHRHGRRAAGAAGGGTRAGRGCAHVRSLPLCLPHPSLPMCLPHCLLLTVSPTVSLPRRLSPTVSPSPPLSHCVPLAVSLPLCPPLPHRLSPTVSPSPSLSHGVSVPLSLPLTVSLPHGAPSRLLGRTALHLAAAHDRPATLVLLAEAYGADVDAVDQQVRFCRYCCQN